MVSSTIDPAVQTLLNKHEFLELIESSENENTRVRVKCQLTQHEMLPRADVIKVHLKSKKFLKARNWYCHDYSQYEPYIVPHRRLPKCLFCNVTSTILNRIPSEVEKHVQGKRYKRMKQHVKITVTKSKDDEDDMTSNKNDFDADAFEFENSQVIYSDDDEEEKSKKEDGDDELQEPDTSVKKEKEEDDMADLYPDDESDNDDMAGLCSDDESGEDEKIKVEDGDETMKEKPKKKRPAKSISVSKKTLHPTKKAKSAR